MRGAVRDGEGDGTEEVGDVGRGAVRDSEGDRTEEVGDGVRGAVRDGKGDRAEEVGEVRDRIVGRESCVDILLGAPVLMEAPRFKKQQAKKKP